MLDVQRHRNEIYREEVAFARKFVWCHMIAGAALIALLLFHELFWWCVGAVVWYAGSLYATLGYMNELRWCQWILTGLFAGVAATGLYFTTWVYPALEPVKAPIVPHTFMPMWVGMVNFGYSVAAALMACSRKLRKAGSVGFTLW